MSGKERIRETKVHLPGDWETPQESMFAPQSLGLKPTGSWGETPA